MFYSIISLFVISFKNCFENFLCLELKGKIEHQQKHTKEIRFGVSHSSEK